MNSTAIKVAGLGKCYRIGRTQQRHDTLRDMLVGSVGERLRGIRSHARSSQADSAIWALRDVSFEVGRGEVVGVIGHNGAGKSTLLKILSRITEPTEGYAQIRGRVASLLEVGTGFHPELTGRENISLSGSILGMKREEINRKFDEIVAFAEVEKFIDTPVKRYSSGMYVRLAFAVAANLEPEVLLVDEVLAVGDAAFQKKCLGKMGNVAREGNTVLVVSHNMASILGLCSSAVLLESGQVRYQGAPGEVVKLYQKLGAHSAGTERLAHPSTTLAGQRSGFSIRQVRFLTGDGVETSGFQTGDSMGVEITVATPADGEAFAVGVALFSQEGVYCYGINTFLDGVPLVAADDTMTVLLRFDSVNLMDGVYAASVAVTNDTATYEHDYRPRQYHFTVTSPYYDHGLTYLPHNWVTGKGER